MFKLYQKFLACTSKIEGRDVYLWYFTSVCAGIIIAVAKIYWLYLFFATVVICATIFIINCSHLLYSKNVHQLFIMLAFVAMGFLLMSWRLQNFSTYRAQEKYWHKVQGEISQIRHYDSGVTWLVLNDIAVMPTAKSTDWQKLDTAFSLRVFVKPVAKTADDMLSWQAGDRIVVDRAKVRHRSYNTRKRSNINIYDLTPSAFVRVSRAQVKPVKSDALDYVYFWHQYVQEQTSGMSPMGQAFVKAVLTGQRQSPAFRSLSEILRPSGLGHIVAISGLHMSLLANFTFWLTLWFFSYFAIVYLHFSLRKIAAVMSVVVCFVYLSLTGFPLTAQRAFVMITVFCSAIVLDRKSRGVRSMSLAGLIFLLLWPEYLLHIGLQFSFLSVLILLCLYEDYQQQQRSAANISILPLVQNTYLLYFLWAVYVNSLLAIAVNLIQIYHFAVIYTYTPVTNLVLLPIFTLLIMPLIFLSIPLILLGIAAPSLFIIDLVLQLLLTLSTWIVSLPFSVIPAQISIANILILILAFYACLLFKKITYKPIAIIMIPWLITRVILSL